MAEDFKGKALNIFMGFIGVLFVTGAFSLDGGISDSKNLIAFALGAYLLYQVGKNLRN